MAQKILLIVGVVLAVLGVLLLTTPPVQKEVEKMEWVNTKKKVDMVGGVLLGLGVLLVAWAVLARKGGEIKKSSSMHPMHSSMQM
jgi:uncharacterized membrane protein